MQVGSELTMESFLPLARMRELGKTAHSTYIDAQPFPHIVFDNFFDPELVDRVLSEFPAPGAIRWQSFDNAEEVKLASSVEATFGPTTRLFLYHLNSMTFLNFLSQVTGIENLIPDPGFEGGGLHQIVRGGKLGVHADFNRHTQLRLDRRLNVLLYLNQEWKEEYGGHFELWDQQMTAPVRKILPIFNRCAIFSTTSTSYHGHPNPLACPAGRTRKSMAIYYYSNGRPAEEVNDEHTTLFQEQPGASMWRIGNVKKFIRAVTPPILMDAVSRNRRA